MSLVRTLQKQIFARTQARLCGKTYLSTASTGAGKSMSLVEFSMSHADFSHCRNQGDMVTALEKTGALKTPAVIEAFRAVDRALFIPTGDKEVARYAEPYQNAPQKLFHGATISTPHHHAVVMELIAPHIKLGHRVLDLGCGTGYLSCVFAKLVGNDGLVLGTDRIPSCLVHARETSSLALGDELSKVVTYDDAYNSSEPGKWNQGPILGIGPFDVIHSGFTMPDELVAEWLNALAPNGVMVTAVTSSPNEKGKAVPEQQLYLYKLCGDSEVKKEVIMQVMCQAMETGQLDENAEEFMTHKEKLERVQTKLLSWKQEYEKENGMPPSREAMDNDPVAKRLFEEFAHLRKRVWEK